MFLEVGESSLDLTLKTLKEVDNRLQKIRMIIYLEKGSWFADTDLGINKNAILQGAVSTGDVGNIVRVELQKIGVEMINVQGKVTDGVLNVRGDVIL